MNKKIIGAILVFALILTAWAVMNMNKEPEFILLSTTTSTQDSGLLDYILPSFTEETGIEVKVVAVGTGKALQMGRDGEADVLLVHAKASEVEFIEEGHGVERFDVMYNDFILVGPQALEYASIGETLEGIKNNEAKFVSRGDDSGTHKKELSIWATAGIEPEGDWYVSAGKGMGDVLQMANELRAYTLTDRATYLSMKDALELEIVFEADALLLNEYGVIAVDPTKNNEINNKGANAFIAWLLSSDTQEMIGEFGQDLYGQALFFPNAK
ncbi:substrate-binding domain-containing protein [Petrocella sp. FN5]|uniref:substrate-binding domain-containing protein n=1 Tax=Petrocella sp. FN5 TaxID=3032002 RepID=UPI0023DB7477|nr:substrate-binding domain-containing protein [Petrocella sp. FN5]MDF1616586.1 substrate-binding domain-containing protein [Petrocella sp. FN5]